MLDFISNLWNGLVPLWGMSWWWVGLIGLVVGVVWGTFKDEEPELMGFLGLLVGVFWGLFLMVILFVGTPVLVGFAAWRFAEWVKNWEKKPKSMTLESEDLQNGDDLR